MAEPAQGREVRVRRTPAKLPLTEPEHSNAIHGLVRWVAWRAREHEPHRVVLGHVLDAQPGYPFTLELADRVRADCERSHRTDDCDEHREAPCPYGSGAHPYLTLGAETIDDVLLRVPARTVLRSDDRGIPVGTVAVDGTELDFRTARRIGEAKLDNGYTDLERGDARSRPRHGRDRRWIRPDAVDRRRLPVRHGVHR